MTYKTYLVGGAVRDRMLQKLGYDVRPSDRDWVVVGATAQEMADRGFIPVGADFPVFLHPETHEEYALARTERKTARGYHGFQFYASPDVTLPEDLRRRDLTINAMAMDEAGTLIDPYGGLQDLKNHVLRHVSAAFKEDPVRILRLARFAARFPDFSVAEGTRDLLEEMVIAGEADALVAERVWAELSRGLMERKPSRMLRILSECGYWERAHAALPVSASTIELIDAAADKELPLNSRTALLFSAAPAGQCRALCQAMRLPAETASFVQLFRQVGADLVAASDVASLCRVFSRSDVLRRPERFTELLALLQLATPSFDAKLTDLLAGAYRDVDAGKIAASLADKSGIARAVAQARERAVLSAATRLR